MKSVINILSLLLPLTLAGQQIKNVDFHQKGDEILINYDFEKGGWRKCYNIKAYYSVEGSYEWHQIRNATGDKGECIGSDSNKEIRWKVLKAEKGIVKPIKIKVVANKQELDDHLAFWLYLDYDLFPQIQNMDKTLYSTNDHYLGSFSAKYGWFRQEKSFLGVLGEIQYKNASNGLNNDLEGINPFFNGIGIDFKIGPMLKIVNNEEFQVILYGMTGVTLFSNYSVHFNENDKYEFSSNDVYNENESYNFRGFGVSEKNNPDQLILKGEKSIQDKQEFPFPLSCGMLLSFDWLDIDLGASIIELGGLRDFERDFNDVLEKAKLNKEASFSQKEIMGSIGLGFNF